MPIIADIDAGFGNAEATYLLAKKMIDKAVEAGVSAVKFQFHVLEDEMLKITPKSNNFVISGKIVTKLKFICIPVND